LMFHPKAFIFVLLFPVLLGFWNQFIILNLTLMRIFGRFLGSGLLECPMTPLVCCQVPFPIFSGDVRLISLKVIALVTYLGNWVLIAPVITYRFLLDFHSFLLEAISANYLGPLFFRHI